MVWSEGVVIDPKLLPVIETSVMSENNDTNGQTNGGHIPGMPIHKRSDKR